MPGQTPGQKTELVQTFRECYVGAEVVLGQDTTSSGDVTFKVAWMQEMVLGSIKQGCSLPGGISGGISM